MRGRVGQSEVISAAISSLLLLLVVLAAIAWVSKIHEEGMEVKREVEVSKERLLVIFDKEGGRAIVVNQWDHLSRINAVLYLLSNGSKVIKVLRNPIDIPIAAVATLNLSNIPQETKTVCVATWWLHIFCNITIPEGTNSTTVVVPGEGEAVKVITPPEAPVGLVLSFSYGASLYNIWFKASSIPEAVPVGLVFLSTKNATGLPIANYTSGTYSVYVYAGKVSRWGGGTTSPLKIYISQNLTVTTDNGSITLSNVTSVTILYYDWYREYEGNYSYVWGVRDLPVCLRREDYVCFCWWFDTLNVRPTKLYVVAIDGYPITPIPLHESGAYVDGYVSNVTLNYVYVGFKGAGYGITYINDGDVPIHVTHIIRLNSTTGYWVLKELDIVEPNLTKTITVPKNVNLTLLPKLPTYVVSSDYVRVRVFLVAGDEVKDLGVRYLYLIGSSGSGEGFKVYAGLINASPLAMEVVIQPEGYPYQRVVEPLPIDLEGAGLVWGETVKNAYDPRKWFPTSLLVITPDMDSATIEPLPVTYLLLNDVDPISGGVYYTNVSEVVVRYGKGSGIDEAPSVIGSETVNVTNNLFTSSISVDTETDIWHNYGAFSNAGPFRLDHKRVITQQYNPPQNPIVEPPSTPRKRVDWWFSFTNTTTTGGDILIAKVKGEPAGPYGTQYKFALKIWRAVKDEYTGRWSNWTEVFTAVTSVKWPGGSELVATIKSDPGTWENEGNTPYYAYAYVIDPEGKVVAYAAYSNVPKPPIPPPGPPRSYPY